MKINTYLRLQCLLRLVFFDFSKQIGVFRIIKAIPFLEIKEPFKRWHQNKLN